MNCIAVYLRIVSKTVNNADNEAHHRLVGNIFLLVISFISDLDRENDQFESLPIGDGRLDYSLILPILGGYSPLSPLVLSIPPLSLVRQLLLLWTQTQRDSNSVSLCYVVDRSLDMMS